MFEFNCIFTLLVYSFSCLLLVMVSNDFVTQHNTYLDAGREGQTCISVPLSLQKMLKPWPLQLNSQKSAYSSLHTVAGVVLGWYCHNFRRSQKSVIAYYDHCWPFRFKQITVSLLPRKLALRRREGNRQKSTNIAPVRWIGYFLSCTTVWVNWLYFHWVSHDLASWTAFLETSPLRLAFCDNVINLK